MPRLYHRPGEGRSNFPETSGWPKGPSRPGAAGYHKRVAPSNYIRAMKFLAVVSALFLFLAALVNVIGSSAARPGWSGEGRIVGGKPAREDWPFLVAIVERANPDARHGLVCGGSLVGRRWVLTAAHCLEHSRAKDFRLLARTNNLRRGQGARPEKIFRHPGWSSEGLTYDLALLRLRRPLRNPVRISEEIPESGEALVAGWGWTGRRYPWRLREAEVGLLLDERCREIYTGSFSPGSMFCAGGAGKDSCQKDSGGPLIDKKTGLLLGVVSWGGIGCRSWPTVYARPDRGWISSVKNR